MDTIDSYFPYAEYRPGQRHMLEVAAQCAREGGITMIDAPTGSGKSSVVASLLAERNGRKVVIAVRTVSQLTTFIRESDLVKKKHPRVKTVYLVGKSSMCPLGGEGDVYRRCEGVKAFSSSLMRERAEKGALVPSKDPFIVTADTAHGQGPSAHLSLLYLQQDVRAGGYRGCQDGALDRTAHQSRPGDRPGRRPP